MHNAAHTGKHSVVAQVHSSHIVFKVVGGVLGRACPAGFIGASLPAAVNGCDDSMERGEGDALVSMMYTTSCVPARSLVSCLKVGAVSVCAATCCCWHYYSVRRVQHMHARTVNASGSSTIVGMARLAAWPSALTATLGRWPRRHSACDGS